MRRFPASAILLSILLGCALLTGGAHAFAQGDEPPPEATPTLTYEVTLDAAGNAHWNISASFPIQDDIQRDAFEELAAAYVDDDGDEYLPIAPFEAAAAEIGPTVGREMEIENERRSVHHGSNNGTLSVTFQWTGFAAETDGTITLGDVFSSAERPWLASLSAQERLRIHAPEEYLVQSSGMPVENSTMVMNGPRTIGASEFQAVFVPAHSGTDDGTSTTLALVGGMGLLSIVAAIALTATYVRGRHRPAPDEPAGAVADEAEAEPSEESTVTPEPDPSLLSDEERVLRLIDQNGGRMKQANIVEETDWSNAKVSQLLTKMADEGRVEKLRIGRENLISRSDGTEDDGPAH